MTPPGTRTHGRSRMPASAIIIAGNPLSHVATPSTPGARGSERISRRRTIAASLRYGRLSIMPGVPCVRPSQGSVQKPANGMQPSVLQFLRRRLHQQADFPMAGVIAQRDRLCHRRRASPPDVLRMRNSLRPSWLGSSPCRHPASSQTDRRWTNSEECRLSTAAPDGPGPEVLMS